MFQSAFELESLSAGCDTSYTVLHAVFVAYLPAVARAAPFNFFHAATADMPPLPCGSNAAVASETSAAVS